MNFFYAVHSEMFETLTSFNNFGGFINVKSGLFKPDMLEAHANFVASVSVSPCFRQLQLSQLLHENMMKNRYFPT